MPDSPELQAAKDKVAELERKAELEKRKAKLQLELDGVSNELANLGKPAPSPKPGTNPAP